MGQNSKEELESGWSDTTVKPEGITASLEGDLALAMRRYLWESKRKKQDVVREAIKEYLVKRGYLFKKR